MSFYRSHEFCEIVLCVSIKNTQYRGVEQLVARQAHNLEVGGPNPSSATLSSDGVVFYIFGHQERN